MWSKKSARRTNRRSSRAQASPHEPQLVRTASVDEVLTAMEALDMEAPWECVAPTIRHMLPRLRPLPPMEGRLPVRTFQAGLSAGLGRNIGPANMFVTDSLLDHWGVTEENAFRQAEANLRRLCDGRKHFPMITLSPGGVPVSVFQSREGWASALLLFPDLLERVMSERPAIILAPMRDALVQLPLDVSPLLTEWILEEFASEDMNALAIPPLSWVDGRLGLAGNTLGLETDVRAH